MTTVAQHLDVYVIDALPGFGFSVDQSNRSCTHFLSKLKQFISELAKYYDAAVVKEFNRPDCSKSKEDLVSWAHKETSLIVYSALSNYRNRIWDAESMIPQSQKISCEVALTYLVWLVEETDRSRSKRVEYYEVQPLSRKAIWKRSKHDWTPYAVEPIFAEIRRILGL